MEDGWALDGAGGGSPQVATNWLQVIHLHPYIHESYLRPFAPTELNGNRKNTRGKIRTKDRRYNMNGFALLLTLVGNDTKK